MRVVATHRGATATTALRIEPGSRPRLLALPERRLRLTRALPDLTGVATLAAGFEED
ncbi:hypothetical protein [Amaricoccus sp.]|uniref:hypothetical protein n=1 Tax=Amaricoccus sp. TaxID=1872485 RepID=UPI001B471CC5|nr:hypothetical protein [Amaricoccus sp.]MBP7002938.1 hypothetical protein [Amaricoccus sp.]